jgi:hypothetical protein
MAGDGTTPRFFFNSTAYDLKPASGLKIFPDGKVASQASGRRLKQCKVGDGRSYQSYSRQVWLQAVHRKNRTSLSSADRS